VEWSGLVNWRKLKRTGRAVRVGKGN